MLETKHLILRPITLEDAQDLYDYSSDPLVTEMVTYDTYSSIDDAYTSLKYFFLNRDPKVQFEAMAIVDKETGKMIGTCDASKIFNVDNVEVGYVLNRDFWNKGYMSEAMKVYCLWLFEDKKIRRIELTHNPKNIASKRVAEKTGFIYEGNRRGYTKIDDTYTDMPYYSLLKGDLVNEGTK